MDDVTGRKREGSATRAPRNHIADLRGVTGLAVDATAGLTELVEAMQVNIACMSAKLGGPVVEGAVNGIAWLVYRSIHGEQLGYALVKSPGSEPVEVS